MPPDLVRSSSAAMRAALLACALISAACDRGDAPAPVETSGATGTASIPAGAPASATPDVLGAMLVVPGDTSGVGIVIYPDAPVSQVVASAPLTLFAASGESASANASLVMTDSQVCGEAALVRIQDSLATGWSVAILGASVTPVRMDSIETMSRADSSRLAAQLARLASSLPMQDTSRFKGLPFAVLTARGFEAHGRRVVVSHLVRRVPHEAAPAEEHTFMVAERDTATTAAVLALAYHLRSEGTEDTAENVEVLAAVRGRDTVWLIIARDNTARTIYQVLERPRVGPWRSRWSRVLSC